jgi:hypothetical protein
MRRLLILTALLLLPACADRGPTTSLSDDEFVSAMVALRQAGRAAGSNEAAFVAAREEILQSMSITREELEAYVAAHTHDLGHMAEIWERINARLAEVQPQ